MSHLLAPTHTLADAIPLGRRITEIMAEKGPAYTIAAMAKRLDINRETLRLMLKGEREIYTFELEKIAQDLKVPVERILQSDITGKREQVKQMIIRNARSEQQMALEMARQAASVSIGLTERCIGENELACVYINLNQFDRAHDLLTKIRPDTKLMLEKFNDPEVFLWATGNLLVVLTSRKEYDHLLHMVAEAEPYFSANPRVGGIMCYTVAKYLDEVEGDIEAARAKYNHFLDYYRQVEVIAFARAQLSVGVFEYRQGDYTRAEELFQQAMRTFNAHQDIRYQISIRYFYGQLLIRLKRFPQAIEYLLELLQMIRLVPDIHNIIDFEVQTNILLAIATDDLSYAEKIIHNQMGTISLQKIALKFLLGYSERAGNQEAKRNYDSIAKQLRGSPIDPILPVVGTDADTLMSLLDLCFLHDWYRPKK